MTRIRGRVSRITRTSIGTSITPANKKRLFAPNYGSIFWTRKKVK